jgi:rhamnogalacturonan endolyase
MKSNFRIFSLCYFLFLIFSLLNAAPRQMEFLNRGLIAVKGTGGVLVSWRYLPDDDPNIAFNVYRNQVKITSAPITGKTNYLDVSGESTSIYAVREVISGIESADEEKAVWILTKRL